MNRKHLPAVCDEDIHVAPMFLCPIKWTIITILSKLSDMKTKTPRPFPSTELQLKNFGQRLRDARLRRGISTILFCERMDVSRDTLNRLEKGDASISIGRYLRALRILGMDKDFDLVAKNDEVGQRLQDAKLLIRTPRGRKRKLAHNEKDANHQIEISSVQGVEVQATFTTSKNRMAT